MLLEKYLPREKISATPRYFNVSIARSFDIFPAT